MHAKISLYQITLKIGQHLDRWATNLSGKVSIKSELCLIQQNAFMSISFSPLISINRRIEKKNKDRPTF